MTSCPRQNVPSTVEQIDLRKPAAGRRRTIEDVRERPAQLAHCLRIAVAGNARVLQRVEAPHVVEPQHVIRVAVCVEHGVDAAQTMRSACWRRSGDVSTRTAVPSGSVR